MSVEEAVDGGVRPRGPAPDPPAAGDAQLAALLPAMVRWHRQVSAAAEQPAAVGSAFPPGSHFYVDDVAGGTALRSTNCLSVPDRAGDDTTQVWVEAVVKPDADGYHVWARVELWPGELPTATDAARAYPRRGQRRRCADVPEVLLHLGGIVDRVRAADRLPAAARRSPDCRTSAGGWRITPGAVGTAPTDGRHRAAPFARDRDRPLPEQRQER